MKYLTTKKDNKTKKIFSAITKNFNWEISTKNLVTFIRWDGVKDEKFIYYGGSLKNTIFRGEGSQKTFYRVAIV